MTQIIPPFRYAIVEDNIYRGAYPTTRNFRFLRRLKLRTLISLTPKAPDQEILDFCTKENIHSEYFSIERFKEDVTVSYSKLIQILQTIMKNDNLPLFIHCLDGANVTGIVVMCLRKLQKWNLPVIFTEFQRFVRNGDIHPSEYEFVQHFKIEQVPMSEDKPKWFRQIQTTVTIKQTPANKPESTPKRLPRNSFSISGFDIVQEYYAHPSRDIIALSLEPLNNKLKNHKRPNLSIQE